MATEERYILDGKLIYIQYHDYDGDLPEPVELKPFKYEDTWLFNSPNGAMEPLIANEDSVLVSNLRLANHVIYIPHALQGRQNWIRENKYTPY